MTTVICDASSVISLSETCNINALQYLKDNAGTAFIIPPAVQKELIESPLHIKHYWFSALRMRRLINAGTLRTVSPPNLRKETRRLDSLANNVFKVGRRPLKILHQGELECLALASSVNAAALLVDEKTTRLLVENPNLLLESIQGEQKNKVYVNQKHLRAFRKNAYYPVIRSTEVIAVAAEQGFYRDYGVDEAEAARAAMHALRHAGCSITHRELDEYEQLF
ncbi:hypothetical protein COU38_03785 [Candidatus Micrarchaeota archaeon CG10_big_fil_rev_8_21_14_0_10_54_18]|nr:MAG: hypothetical protein AUJ15_00955 [Candidatus Micrarchaeota archaeon CG1_02_55_41]PIO02502.1 MAG: hypothetical protein COT57_03715 [Candidatus Micrarchaeota archaeon CG09_land_8_20_14_0_10_55_25]PJD00904.1 MAG: hypothetical protein COU38_03785 [Candidatus Micrarchaeota archaeon CG10_big_fil_rev_8_21_14_0_10_54_18]